jgi:hypothetical protein
MTHEARATAKRRQRHREMLVIAAGVVLLAFLLEVRTDGRVALSFLPQWPLPETCSSRAWFGVECPGCGLTRSFVHLAHGRFRESYHLHHLGWLLALAVCLQFPYRLTALATPHATPLGRNFPRACGWTLIALLFANWLVSLAIAC